MPDGIDLCIICITLSRQLHQLLFYIRLVKECLPISGVDEVTSSFPVCILCLYLHTGGLFRAVMVDSRVIGSGGTVEQLLTRCVSDTNIFLEPL